MPTVLDAAAHEENADLALRDAPCDWRLTDATDFLSEEDSACSARLFGRTVPIVNFLIADACAYL